MDILKIVEVITDLDKILERASNHVLTYDGVIDWVADIGDAALRSLIPAYGAIATALDKFMDPEWRTKLILMRRKLVDDFFSLIGLKGIIEWVARLIGELAASARELTRMLVGGFKAIKGVKELLSGNIIEGLGMIFDGVKAVWSEVLPFITGVLSGDVDLGAPVLAMAKLIGDGSVAVVDAIFSELGVPLSNHERKQLAILATAYVPSVVFDDATMNKAHPARMVVRDMAAKSRSLNELTLPEGIVRDVANAAVDVANAPLDLAFAIEDKVFEAVREVPGVSEVIGFERDVRKEIGKGVSEAVQWVADIPIVKDIGNELSKAADAVKNAWDDFWG